MITERCYTVNRYRDSRTEHILSEAEALVWDLQELDADVETDPDSWAYPTESRAFILAAIEDAHAELERRTRLRGRPGSPPWPITWRDRRPDAETIRRRIDLADYAERMTGVVFERAGDELKARCPLPGHDDRTPSFYVHPGKQVFNCFGCGRGGDLFNFVEYLYQLPSFTAALDALAADPEMTTTGEAVRLG